MKGWQKTGLELLDNVNNLSPTAKKLIKAAKVAGPMPTRTSVLLKGQAQVRDARLTGADPTFRR